MQNFKILNVQVADLHNLISKRTWGDWKVEAYEEETKTLYIGLHQKNVRSGVDSSYNRRMKKEILEWMKKRNHDYRHLPTKMSYGGPYIRPAVA